MGKVTVMNLASILLLILVGILFFAAIRHMVKNGGVCSCGTVGKHCNGRCGACSCKTCAKKKEK
ncbi:MAG: hypothetical protein HFI75_09205 [Lachnospiraceae bacterium]|nr:hypothetical protein [Lachnospiraceae bacterium]